MSIDYYCGEIRMIAGTYAPRGWEICDGRSLERNKYLTLFSVISYTYGGGGEYFNLPDLMGRVPVHKGQGPGMTLRKCGQSFGEEDVLLTEADTPKHRHRVCLGGAKSGSGAYPGTELTASGNYIADCTIAKMYINQETAVEMEDGVIGYTGAPSPLPHQNMMPSLCINFIIATEGSLMAGKDEE